MPIISNKLIVGKCALYVLSRQELSVLERHQKSEIFEVSFKRFGKNNVDRLILFKQNCWKY